jgi:hypothetical protein
MYRSKEECAAPQRPFKHSVVEDPTWAVEFVVQVVEKPNVYPVKTAEMKKWLARNGKSPKGDHTDRW